MKRRHRNRYPTAKSAAFELKESGSAVAAGEVGPMIRTQIYLNQNEYDFVQREAARRSEPMAAVIRGLIDEKMELPEIAWSKNPMLESTVSDPDWKSAPDAALNHDHYLYGSPKKWIKVKGEYVAAPPLPEDYFQNRASAAAYDKMLRQMDEAQ